MSHGAAPSAEGSIRAPWQGQRSAESRFRCVRWQPDTVFGSGGARSHLETALRYLADSSSYLTGPTKEIESYTHLLKRAGVES